MVAYGCKFGWPERHVGPQEEAGVVDVGLLVVVVESASREQSTTAIVDDHGSWDLVVTVGEEITVFFSVSAFLSTENASALSGFVE